MIVNGGVGILEKYPFEIVAKAAPSTQKVINFHISVTAESSYRTQDSTGTDVIVNSGSVIFNKNISATSNNLTYSLMPQDCTLENNEPYKLTVTASMDSGLTATATMNFTVHWEEVTYYPDAKVAIDRNSVSAYISPICRDAEGTVVDNVVLSVFRREFDGTFTEIASEIPNYGSVSVTDPHPGMDYARYRIVARNKNTNVLSYSDISAYKVNEPGIIIQWDEEYASFDSTGNYSPGVRDYHGSMVRLPYNVDTSESSDVDVSLVEYIGRRHPVAYFGTQIGKSDSWTCEIPRTDKETIYALRRLQQWMGTVYIREQNGVGYNAFVNITFSNKHDGLTIPITLSVKQVEGGI